MDNVTAKEVTQRLEDLLLTVTEKNGEFDDVRDLQEEGFLEKNAGLVLTLGNRQRFVVTVTKIRSRYQTTSRGTSGRRREDF